MTTTKQTVIVEYSMDSLADISADAFEAECVRQADDHRGHDIEFRVGLRNRQTIDGEQSDIAERIVERAFAACCAAN